MAGLQSGKTTAGAVWSRIQFDAYPKETGLICAPCYDEQTQVLTDNGWKYFINVKKEDKIACLDKDELIFEKPLEIYKERYIGEMIGAKGKSVDFLTTPNHRMYCRPEWNKNSKWEIKTAKEIYKKRYKMKRDVKNWNGNPEGKSDWFEFLGFWFAEGCAEFNEKSRKYRITITQKEEVYVDDLMERVKQYLPKEKYFKNKRQLSGFNWVIYDKELAREFVKYGKADNKEIPRWILDSNINCLKAFLKGYLLGDGKECKNQTIGYTNSEKLADGLQEIALKCGWSATIRRYDYPQWKNAQYLVFIYKNIKGREITINEELWYKKDYDGYVYCVKVRTGIIYVRRNGITLWSGNTYKILTQSTLPKFFELNPDLKRYYKKFDNEILIPKRGTIFIRSTENPNVIEGMTLKWAWADEAGQMKLDAWINLQGRLSILKGSLFVTSTPYTLNWLYTDFYEQWKKGNPDYLVVQCRSCDNPYFPKEEYERVKLTMDPRTFRRRYDGLFEKMEGLVYEDFMPFHILEPKLFQFKEVICGIDWGFNNPAAIAVIGITDDSTFYLIDEYYKSEKTTAEIIVKLREFNDKYKIRMWYPDPAEPDRLEEMKRAGLYPREVSKAKDSIKHGIDKVRELIRRNQFRVFNTCRYALEEFSIYHYPEGVKEEPIKEDDHLMDAIRYAIYGYQPAPRIIPRVFRELVNPAR